MDDADGGDRDADGGDYVADGGEEPTLPLPLAGPWHSVSETSARLATTLDK